MFDIPNHVIFMKMKQLIYLIISTIFIFTTCKINKIKDIVYDDEVSKPSNFIDITAFDANFPIELSKIDFEEKTKTVTLSDFKIRKIEQVVERFYYEECQGDSAETYFSKKDIYINTIQTETINGIILYGIILKQIPSMVTCKILFFDTKTDAFLEEIFNFKIYALYDFKDGKLVASNLKEELKFDTPEIELSDFTKDGIKEFTFNRLNHNGTFNAIEKLAIQIENGKITNRRHWRTFK